MRCVQTVLHKMMKNAEKKICDNTKIEALVDNLIYRYVNIQVVEERQIYGLLWGKTFFRCVSQRLLFTKQTED